MTTEQEDKLRDLSAAIKMAAKKLSVRLQDALEEEKGIDLPEIEHGDDLQPYVIINDEQHLLHVVLVPDTAAVLWIYVISPSLPGLENSVRLMQDSSFEQLYINLEAAIDEYDEYLESI